MKTHAQKLQDIDARLRRWMPRLTRSQNEVAKLIKQRRKLEVHQAIANMTAPPGKPTPNQVAALAEAAALQEPLEIPTELKRSDSVEAAARAIVEGKPVTVKIDERTAKRLAKNDVKRRGRSMFSEKDMPLVGQAALKAVRKRERK